MSFLRFAIDLLPTLLRLLPTEAGRVQARRLAILGIFGFLASVLAATALAFIVAAIYMALAQVMSPAAAAALTALILLLVALILMLTALATTRRDVPLRRTRPSAPAFAPSMDSLGAATRRIGGQIRVRPLMSVLIAAALGVLAARLERRR